MLTFRLDFNEYYAEKFYQTIGSDFRALSSQEEYKGSAISFNREEEDFDPENLSISHFLEKKSVVLKRKGNETSKKEEVSGSISKNTNQEVKVSGTFPPEQKK